MKVVLGLAILGFRYKQIAHELDICYRTVENDIAALKRKYRARNISQLIHQTWTPENHAIIS